MWQREHHMEMGAGQQPLQFLFNPLLSWAIGAGRAAPVVARMEASDAAVPFRAAQHLTPERRGVAAHDGVRSSQLPGMQAPTLCVVREVLSKDLLHRASHCDLLNHGVRSSPES